MHGNRICFEWRLGAVDNVWIEARLLHVLWWLDRGEPSEFGCGYGLDARDREIRLWAIGAETATAGFLIVGMPIAGLALRRLFAAEIGAFDAVEAAIERHR